MFNGLRNALRAAAFTRDLVGGERPSLFKRMSGQPEVTSHIAFTGPGLPALHYDLYLVPDRERRAAIVVTHGFTHEGNADPRLQALCRRLARAGFVVMAPQLDEMRHYRLGLGDTAALELSVDTIADHPAVDPDRIGVAAFSFGAAPTLIALAHEPLKSRVAAAMIFGGFFDLRRTFHYVLTGRYCLDGVPLRAELPTANDDRWKFLRANVDVLPASPTRDRFMATLNRLVDDPSHSPVDPQWSGAEHAAFTLFANRDPDRFDALYAEVAPYVDDWVRRLSPCEYAEQVTTPLLVIHSRTDPKTPYTESLAISRGLPNAPPVHLAVLNTFSHVDLTLNWRSARAIANDVLPGLLMIWRVARWLMQMQRQPANASARESHRGYFRRSGDRMLSARSAANRRRA